MPVATQKCRVLVVAVSESDAPVRMTYAEVLHMAAGCRHSGLHDTAASEASVRRENPLVNLYYDRQTIMMFMSARH